jgi:DNA repair exonuclease SbcCD ATPase subunit
MEHENAYIKVTWPDTASAFSKESVRRVKEYFKEKYNTRHVIINTKVISNKSDTKLKSLEISESILDLTYQNKLLKEYVKQSNDFPDINYDHLDRLDKKVNEIISQKGERKLKYNKWEIKSIEYSNFLSFGENNKINFTELDGITAVESNPRNFGGKTTATIDALLFLFFNSSTKHKNNIEVFNRFSDKDHVKVKGVIEIDGHDYIIERNFTRKLGRTNNYTVKAELEFFKILPDGTHQNLSGEQRRETETFIQEAIGSESDFLQTILTTGSNLEDLIGSTATERGRLLTRFIGLDALKEKDEVARDEMNKFTNKMVSNHYDTFTLQSEIEDLHKQIEGKDNDITKTKKELEESTQRLKTLNDEKDKLLSEKHGDVDETLFKTNPKTIENEIADIDTKISKTNKVLNETLVKEPKEYYLEETHEEVKDKIRDIDFDLKVLNNNITQLEKEIKNLEDGSICSACNRPLENVDNTKEIKSKKGEIKNIKSEITKKEKNQKELKSEETKHSTLKKEYDLYEKNKLINTRYELEIKQFEIDKSNKIKLLEYFEANKKKHERNLEIDKQLLIYGTKIETANSDIKQCNILIERYTNEIDNFKKKITTNRDLIKTIEKEKKTEDVFKAYRAAFGKSGISKTILKDMIPFLNNELSHLLEDSCLFKLEIRINEKNDLGFVMIDNETRVVKPLMAGSGYERTIASLALRSVLTKVSALPKPNLVVMDEVFGKVADDNIEMVGEFFKKIKDYFDNILVISHNPLIRTWSDNLLMIEKDDNISKIESINVKI